MHLVMLLTVLLLTWCLRLPEIGQRRTGQQRWRWLLRQFLLSPLLLLTTAIALIWMGPKGTMVRWWEGWLSYVLALGFWSLAVVLALKLTLEGWRSLQQVRTYPTFSLPLSQDGLSQDRRSQGGQAGRLLPTAIPFVAQVGFWQPELVVSQGLLDTLDPDHLDAVLTHEQAHHHYRDTFWFFWLGWLRRLTFWLPQTETLWQELLILREQRADAWASQTVDPLLLAESVIQMAGAPDLYSESFCAAFSSVAPRSRLEERIALLLSEPESFQPLDLWMWAWLLLALLPLASIPFHH